MPELVAKQPLTQVFALTIAVSIIIAMAWQVFMFLGLEVSVSWIVSTFFYTLIRKDGGN